ncbi:hypothetical protein Leryth_023831 [Lithospermum erythrorhizon]|nr:hypothetical protein Leryth_023831 [Lithospermum erythrorhizon]
MFITHRLPGLNLFSSSSKPKLLLLISTLLPQSSSQITSKCTTFEAQCTTFKAQCTTLIHPTTSLPDQQNQELDNPNENTQVPLSLDKLFMPPEAEISSKTAPLSARILNGSNIVLGKYGRDAQIVSAEFVKSSVDIEQCPSDGLPEFALVGRSNVGKSSLLNSIVRRKKLALTSKKPGEQTLLNLYKQHIFLEILPLERSTPR